jgi:alpha/beta superfamily hydrolase
LALSEPETVVVESVRFAAGPHLLEGELAYGEDVRAPRGAVLLACSHPLLGGDMHNNVVRGLGDGLAERRLITLRFNYRGVGRSQGPAVDVARHVAQFLQTSHAPDEMDLGRDVQAAAAFLRQTAGGQVPLTLIGYSFGCSLLPFVDLPGPTGAYVLIAPPLGRHGGEGFAEVRAPILAVGSEDDFATDAGRLRAWFGRLPGPKRLVLERLDNHFFRGHERWLAGTVFAFLREVGALVY